MGLPCGTFTEFYQQDKAVIRTKTQWLLAAFVVAFAFSLPFILSDHLLHTISMMGVYIIATLGLQILTGLAGQLSIGHAAFMAVGAFSSGLLASRLGLNFWIAWPCGAIMAGIVGLFFGLPSLRVKGYYLVMTTLAAQYIIEYGLLRFPNVTGGFQGVFVPPATLGDINFHKVQNIYYLILISLIIATVLVLNLKRNKLGRAFIAIRDNDLAAEVMGISLTRYKLLAFFLSCFFAGAAGGLFGQLYGSIVPLQFTIMQSVWFIGYLLVGGLGSTLGPFLGVIVIEGLSEAMTVGVSSLGEIWPETLGFIPSLRNMLFGIIIALFLIFEPRGLAHRWEIVKSWYRLWPFSY